ncbi:hypothetical protein YC2023_034444 [Brassica napus]
MEIQKNKKNSGVAKELVVKINTEMGSSKASYEYYTTNSIRRIHFELKKVQQK